VYVYVTANVPCEAKACEVITPASRTSAVPAVDETATPAYVTVVPDGTSNVGVPVTTEAEGAPHEIAFRAYAGEPPVTSFVAEPEVPGPVLVNRHP